jgi:hypothetical protein
MTINRQRFLAIGLALAALATSHARAEPPLATAELVDLWAETCQLAVEAGRRGDFDWLERRMNRVGLGDRGKGRMRQICLIYLRGYQGGRALRR